MLISIQQRPEVAVAEPVDGELAPADQPRIQPGERPGVAEQNVGGPFALVRRPVVFDRKGLEHRLMCRVQFARDGVQQIWPGGLKLLVHQTLRLGGVVQPGETIVARDMADALRIHRSGQPFLAIETDLHGEREPGLDARMHEPEYRMDLVVVFAMTRLKTQVLALAVAEGAGTPYLFGCGRRPR